MQKLLRIVQYLDLRWSHKQQGQPTRPQHQDHPCSGGIRKHHQRTHFNSLQNTLWLSRPIILSAIRSHGDTQTLKSANEEHLDTGGGSKGSDTLDASNGYVKYINNIGEFDAGKSSGWLYAVNGTVCTISSTQYKVKAGDVIEWRYTVKVGDI